MVSFWPWRGSDNSPASFEKALSQLSQKVAQASSRLDKLRLQSRRFKALWTLYTSFIYILYSLIIILVLGWDRWAALEYTVLCGGPVVIYAVRAAADTIYNYRISKIQRMLDELQKQRDETIEKLKEATKYNSTQMLLEKYGGESPKPKQLADEDPGQHKGRSPKDKTHPPAQIMRTGLAPPPTANIRRPEATPPPPQLQREGPTTSANLSPLPPSRDSAPVGAPEFHPSAFTTSSYSEPRQPQWYDRILDVLLGEDETLAKNRLVLMCQECRLVNGQAPPGFKSLEELGAWRCGSCGAWNNKDQMAKRLAETASAVDSSIAERPRSSASRSAIAERPDSGDGAWDPVSDPGSMSSAVNAADSSGPDNTGISVVNVSTGSEAELEVEDEVEADKLPDQKPTTKRKKKTKK